MRKVISVGNVLEKFITMPLSFRKKHMSLVKRIFQSDSYEEKQSLTWELTEHMLNKESGEVA